MLTASISGGFNICPAELENVVAAHPAVVCVNSETAVMEKELIDLCSVHLGNSKEPGKVLIRHEPPPEAAVGKIKRKDLRERAMRGGLQGESRCRVEVDESRVLIHLR